MRYMIFSNNQLKPTRMKRLKEKFRDWWIGQSLENYHKTGQSMHGYYHDLDHFRESMDKRYGKDSWDISYNLDGNPTHAKGFRFGEMVRIPGHIRKDARERGINRMRISSKGVERYSDKDSKFI